MPIKHLLAGVTDTGWLQVFHDPERAGVSMVNFAVSNLDQHQASLATRGIETGEIVEANKDVRLCSVSDPDNNSITFIGSFRDQY